MKQLLTFFSFILISSLLFVACGDKNDSSSGEKATPAFDIESAKKMIDSLNKEFSGYVGKGDSAGLASLYSNDATLMVPNMATASGKANIQSAFSAMMGAMGPVNITLTTTDIWGYDALITEVGTYVITTKDGKEMDKGKYIDLWKNEDGKWKLHRDIFNSDLPCPPPPPAK